MRRIGLVLATSLTFTQLDVEAQTTAKVYQIGFLSPQSAADFGSYVEAFRRGLHDLGDVEGQNIAILARYADGRADRLPDLAAELVRIKVDVIVAPNNPAIAAAKRATGTIPIVMVLATDRVGAGFVASLARPTGNITGLSSQFAELGPKRLQLLLETAPNVSRVAVSSGIPQSPAAARK